MKKFTRKKGVVSAVMLPEEIALLVSLLEQFVALLDDSAPAPAAPPADPRDPFAAWEADLGADPDEPEVPDDPVLQRLFPTAYPHDPAAASDFRRFTERDQRDHKLADARAMLDDLGAGPDARGAVRIGEGRLDAWLKTLTALRLTLAGRLGITDEESAERLAQVSERDPRSYVYSIYEWLGFAQETLLACV